MAILKEGRGQGLTAFYFPQNNASFSGSYFITPHCSSSWARQSSFHGISNIYLDFSSMVVFERTESMCYRVPRECALKRESGLVVSQISGEFIRRIWWLAWSVWGHTQANGMWESCGWNQFFSDLVGFFQCWDTGNEIRFSPSLPAFILLDGIQHVDTLHHLLPRKGFCFLRV